jgi:hypothetical protein
VTRLLAALGVAAALALPAPAAAQETKSKCSAAKLKAVGAYHAALASCAAKAVAKDQSLDPFCVTKAQVELQDRFAKAERKDDCRTWRESISIQELLDDGFADVLAILEPPPSVCCARRPLASGSPTRRRAPTPAAPSEPPARSAAWTHALHRRRPRGTAARA